MYIRFVITQIDEGSHQPQGLFSAAGALVTSGDLRADERKELQETLAWFNKNLPVPDNRSIGGRAIFWFRTNAQECVRRMWNLTFILRANSYLVEVQKCKHLHNIVYWDALQVAAFPHKYDGKRTFK